MEKPPTMSPAPARIRPHVLKLGGSLLGAPRLRELLARLAQIGAPIVVVGGGGPLADAVRALQPRLALSERAAHRMAILAMEQTAEALADLESGLIPCTDADAIDGAHYAGCAALWLPAAMALDADAAELPESWDVTSDSLAAWLALRLGARLTLVKAAAVTTPDGPPETWVAQGLVDAHFPHLAARLPGMVRAMSLDDALTTEFPLGTAA
ncbi:amino acid kinase family protein [Ancylobacter terrae]|uniref:amino acid kinase family protein n=1 Tax=Ancylobacter sp. sgz301288 TaxID=3342077 RepID=UPI00385E2844